MKREDVKKYAEGVYESLSGVDYNLNASEIRKIASRLWSLADSRMKKTKEDIKNHEEIIKEKKEKKKFKYTPQGTVEESEEEVNNWKEI